MTAPHILVFSSFLPNRKRRGWRCGGREGWVEVSFGINVMLGGVEVKDKEEKVKICERWRGGGVL